MAAAIALCVVGIMMYSEAMLLYQVHYVGRVEYEQYRAEYTALWHAELDGRHC